MKCWVCESESFKFAAEGVRDITANDVKITDSHYGRTLPIYKCEKCGFLQCDTGKYDMQHLYNEVEDDRYAADADYRIKQFVYLLRQISPYINSPNPRILDIGAGIGLLVKAALERGWDAVGLEPSKWLVQHSQGLPIINGVFPNSGCKPPFDVIFLIDVIEHLQNPASVTDRLREYLSPRGIVVLTTPNVSSLAAKIMGKKWWHYRIAHIGYFNKKTLSLLMSKGGLKPLKFMSAKWYFSLGYILERVTYYLPFIKPLIPKRIMKINVTIPLNLFDSFTAVFAADEANNNGNKLNNDA